MLLPRRLLTALVAAALAAPAVVLTASPALAAPCNGQTPTIQGTAGPDTLTGTAGVDVIDAGAGNDVIDGLGGNDVICPGAGDDRVTGGAGTDTVVFDAAGPAVTANLVAGTATGQGADTLATVENLTGTSLNDTLIGGAGANTLRGQGGSDTCTGGAGNDLAVNCEGGTVAVTAGSSDRYQFTFAAGQGVFFDSTAVTATGGTVNWALANTFRSYFTAQNAAVDIGRDVVEAGVHTLTVSGSTPTTTGSLSFRLVTGAQQSGAIAVNAASATRVTIDRPFKRALLTFTATNGQPVAVTVTGATWPATSSFDQQLRLYNGNVVGVPAGSATPIATGFLTPNSQIVIDALPAAGTYTIEIDLFGANLGQANLTVTSPTNQTGTITVNAAAPTAVSIDQIAKRALFTFTNPSARSVTAAVTGAIWPATSSFDQQLRLYNGDIRTQVPRTATPIATGFLTPNGTFTVTTLAAGTYTVEVDLFGANLGTGSLAVTSP